jgi:hypothetical protein
MSRLLRVRLQRRAICCKAGARERVYGRFVPPRCFSGVEESRAQAEFLNESQDSRSVD